MYIFGVGQTAELLFKRKKNFDQSIKFCIDNYSTNKTFYKKKY